MNLARAYAVPMPVGAIKKDILPILKSAMDQGAFQNWPQDYRALAKALQNPDDTPHPRPWELVNLSQEAWGRLSEGAKVASDGNKVYKVGKRQWMLHRAKELGLKMKFGVTNDALRAALKEAGEELDDGNSSNPS